MEFQNYANELIEYLIIGEQRGRLIQYNISEIAKGEIAVLMYLLKEKDGANAYEISRRFDINTSRVAAILNSLCRKEYVKRMSDADDKRKIHVYICLLYTSSLDPEALKHINEALKIQYVKEDNECLILQ